MSTPPQIDRESDVRENQSEPINVLAGASQIESDLPVGAPYIGDRDGHGAADGVEVGLHVRQHKCRSLITIKITTLVMINDKQVTTTHGTTKYNAVNRVTLQKTLKCFQSIHKYVCTNKNLITYFRQVCSATAPPGRYVHNVFFQYQPSSFKSQGRSG